MNLDLESREEGSYWPAFSDLALSMLLVLLLFILAQFLHYDKLFIIEEIARRQLEVEELVTRSTPGVQIARVDNYHQRITFGADSLFASCRTELSGRGVELVRSVAAVLQERAEYFAAIEIEGHTDHRRPSYPACPVRDNWQLSSERATVVLRLFAESELPLERLAGVGRGEHHPLAFDSTEEAYSRNRRIEVLLRYSEAGIME